MVVSCWSTKGGVGTTVVAAAIALLLARRERSALFVDAAGDGPAVLGLSEPSGPGLGDWLLAGAEVAPDGLSRLERPVTAGLGLVPRGLEPLSRPDRAEVLAGVLAADPRAVVVDAGCLSGGGAAGAGSEDEQVRRILASSAQPSLLVTRPCYLALRRAVDCPIRASGVVVVGEPGRVLAPGDVAEVLGVPVVAEVALDVGVARAVDAGLLTSRFPRVLDRSLGRAV